MTFKTDADGEIHVLSGHKKDGARLSEGSSKDLFPEWMSSKQILNDVKNTYKSGVKKLKTQGDRIFVEGTSTNGYKIQMWINIKTNQFESAWPKY